MITVTLISPERSIFDGEATGVVAPAYDGEVGILPRHAPFMTLLGQGRLVIRQQDRTRTFSVRGGFLQVLENEVRIVAEHAEGASDAA